MAVGVVEVKGNRRHRLCAATPHLRDVKLDPIREVDADAMLRARRGASDGPGSGVQHARDHNTSRSSLDVHVELDGLEHRWVDGARHRPIDPPVGRPVIRLATVQDCRKSVSLLLIPALVDDGLTLAVAFVDGAWPGVDQGSAKAVEHHVAKVALIDPNGGEPATVSVRGPG